MRKNILKYDNVLNDQRKVVFEQRKEIMSADDVSDQIVQMREEVVEELVLAPHPRKGLRRAMGRGGPASGDRQDVRTSTCRSSTGPRKKASPTRKCASASRRRSRRAMQSAPPISAPTSCAMPKRRSCFRRSTTTGASISSTWTICASTSACAAMASAIR